jgi:6-phosphogluconolactonase
MPTEPPAWNAAFEPSFQSFAHFYVGTRSAGSNHIHCMTLDLASGALSARCPPCPADSPSYIAIHPDQRTLYAVHELGRSRVEKSGAVSAYAMDSESGFLTHLGRVSSGGAAPCQLKFAGEGRHLLVANYWGGSFSVLPIVDGGALTTASATIRHDGGACAPGRDPGPHVHWVSVDPTGGFLLAVDLGRDEILSYPFDPDRGKPVSHSAFVYRFPEGAGPRHAVFLAGGRQLAVITEFAATVTLLDFDPADGSLTNGRTFSALPDDWRNVNTAAEIAVSSDEKFLYASNRGHDSIAIFALDTSAGIVDRLGFQAVRGKNPRHFAIDPTGSMLIVANQGTDELVVFSVDRQTGDLQPTGHSCKIPAPTCVTFLGKI